MEGGDRGGTAHPERHPVGTRIPAGTPGTAASRVPQHPAPPGAVPGGQWAWKRLARARCGGPEAP